MIGIYAGPEENQPTSRKPKKVIPIEDIIAQSQEVRSQDFAGFSYFFYDSLIGFGSDSEKQERTDKLKEKLMDKNSKYSKT